MAVGQRPQKIGEFGVAMLIDEPRHGITLAPSARLADERQGWAPSDQG